MAASDTVEAIETMLRIQAKRQNFKETKSFLPLSFDRFIFICLDIITSNTESFRKCLR